MHFRFDDGERPKLAALVGLPVDTPNDKLAEELSRFFTSDSLAASAAVARRKGLLGATNVEDLRREFYDYLPQLDLGDWAWIRSVYVDPDELIVDDDDGSLFRVSYSISDDVITFGDPQEVKMNFVTASMGTIAAEPIGVGGTVLIAFEDKETSRTIAPPRAPARKEREQSPPTPASDPATGAYLNECEATIAAAIKVGKFPTSRVPHYRRRWATDPEGTKARIAKMVALPELRGGAWADDAAFEDDTYPAAWLGAPSAPVASQGVRRSRVQSEEN